MTRAAEQAPPTWVAAHLYFHGDLDDVVAGVLDPAVRDTGLPYFFLRYWEGGPHLRVRVRVGPGDRADAVRADLRRRAEDWFARHPSADRMSDGEYQEIRRWALRLEPWTVPTAGLRPNNTLRFEPYRPEHDRYGRGRRLAAAEEHFGEASEIARTVVRDRMPVAQRELLALCALVATWTVAHPDPARLADWAAHRARFDPAIASGGDDPRGWGTRHADTVRSVVRHTVRAASGPEADDTHGAGTLRARWTRSVRTLRSELLAEQPPGVPPVGDPPERVLDHCAHLHCNRMGLGLGQEATLRSLAAAGVLDAWEAG